MVRPSGVLTGRQDARSHYAIGAIYDAAAKPEQWPAALAAIAAVFGAKGTVLLYNRDDGSMTAIVSPGLETALQEYDREWWQHDIRVQRGHERSLLTQTGVYTDRDIATPEELQTHPFYQKFLAKHGLGYFMGGSVSPLPRVFAGLSVQGPLGAAPYSDDDVALMRDISLHVERALSLTIRLISAEATNLALGDALTRLRSGVLILNSQRHIVFANSAAGELLGPTVEKTSAWPGPEVTRHRDALVSAIEYSLSAPISARPGPIVLIGRDERRLIAHVVPVRHQSLQAEAFVGARALVLLVDQEPGAPADPPLVRELLDVTLGEARVAALVGTGMSLQQVASSLGITEETARTVIKRVYAKTGVSRQSELAAILVRATLADG